MKFNKMSRRKISKRDKIYFSKVKPGLDRVLGEELVIITPIVDPSLFGTVTRSFLQVGNCRSNEDLVTFDMKVYAGWIVDSYLDFMRHGGYGIAIGADTDLFKTDSAMQYFDFSAIYTERICGRNKRYKTQWTYVFTKEHSDREEVDLERYTQENLNRLLSELRPRFNDVNLKIQGNALYVFRNQ